MGQGKSAIGSPLDRSQQKLTLHKRTTSAQQLESFGVNAAFLGEGGTPSLRGMTLRLGAAIVRHARDGLCFSSCPHRSQGMARTKIGLGE